jgi:proteasome lid subunit RPN8/RPN11
VRKLARGMLQGEFAITAGAVEAAERLLPSFRDPGGDHEGMVFLLGREMGSLTLLTTALAPAADHGPGHVICEPGAVAAAQRAGREHGLALLAQLHSHPGASTEHSEGDDDLVLMPFEGMLSLVAPWYGRTGLRPLHAIGVHQFQGGRWMLAEPESVRKRMHLLPAGIDLR